MNTLKTKSYAKINLRLKVLGRRPDGYHLLSMLNCLIDFYDDIELTLDSSAEITCAFKSGNTSMDNELSDPSKNLAAKAAKAIFDILNLNAGLKINALKRIPAGGGLGGGSSNAACVLNCLPELLLKSHLIGQKELSHLSKIIPDIALKLGADVPFFVNAKSGLYSVRGIGEHVTPINLTLNESISVILLLSDIQMPSKVIYGRLRVSENFAKTKEDVIFNEWASKMPDNNQTETYRAFNDLIENDLLEGYLALNPEFAELQNLFGNLPNWTLGLSGSGSSFFLIFNKPGQPQQDELKKISILAQKQGLIAQPTAIIA